MDFLYILAFIAFLFLVGYIFRSHLRKLWLSILYSDIKSLANELSQGDKNSSTELFNTLKIFLDNGLNGSADEFKEFYIMQGNFISLFKALYRAKLSNYQINIKDLISFVKSNGDIDELVKERIIAQNTGVTIPQQAYNLMSINGQKISDLLEIAILTNQLNLDLIKMLNYNLPNEELMKLLNALIIAKNGGIYILSNIVNTLDRTTEDGKRKSLFITQEELFQLYFQGIDVLTYVYTRLKAHQAGIILDINKINILSLPENASFYDYVNALIKAKNEHITTEPLPSPVVISNTEENLIPESQPIETLKQEINTKSLTTDDLFRFTQMGINIVKLVNALIINRDEELGYTLDDFIEHHQIGGDIEKLAIATEHALKMGISKDELLGHFFNGADLVDYIHARILLQDKFYKEIIKVDIDDFEDFYFSRGNILEVLEILKKAYNKNLKLSFSLAAKIDLKHQESQTHTDTQHIIDLRKNISLDNALKWALNPEIFELSFDEYESKVHHQPEDEKKSDGHGNGHQASQPKYSGFTIVTQHGILLKPKVKVTLIGKLEQYLGGSDKKILFDRVTEEIIKEIESHQSHEDVLAKLPAICENVKKRVSENQQLIEHCAYKLVDITIYDLEIINDNKLALELLQAENKAKIHETEAHIIKVEAEAEILKAMAEAYKEGKIKNFNEYHKGEILKSSIPQQPKH